MRRGLVVAIGSILTVSTSCSLVTSLDGLTRGADASTDAAVAKDAPSDDGAIDAGGSRYRAAVLADRPIAYWRLGDPSAAVATDEIKQHDGIYGKVDGGFAFGVTGALVGDPDTAVGFFGRAEIVVGKAFGFANDAPFTLEMWVDATPLDDAGVYMRILSNEAAKEGYHFELGPPGMIGIVLHGTNANTALVTPFAVGGFTHVVCTRDASTLKLYLNGALAAQLASAPINPTTANFTIGGASYGSDLFRGTLDEVAVYDVALSATQIQAHYAAGR